MKKKAKRFHCKWCSIPKRKSSHPVGSEIGRLHRANLMRERRERMAYNGW